MNDYKNYMDNITPDPALKGKILKQARTKSPKARSRTITGYAGLVATAAVLLLAIWVMPGAIRNLRAPDDYVIRIPSAQSAPEIQGGGPLAGGPETGGIPYHQRFAQLDPNNEGTIIPPRDERQWLNPLTPIIDDYLPLDMPSREIVMFTHELTLMQRQSVFPSLSLAFATSAIYSIDGNLLSANAHKTTLQDQFIDVQINEDEITHIAMLDRLSWMLRDDHGDSWTAYVHNIPVTYISHSSEMYIHQGAEVFMFYNALFTLDGLYYHVSAAGPSENLTQQINEVIEGLIFGGPADLSVLANPEIPFMQNDHITIEEARMDPQFGYYMPTAIPPGMTPGVINRWVCQNSNHLLTWWEGPGTAHLRWRISYAEDFHLENRLTAQDLDNALNLPVFEGETHRARRVFALPTVAIEDLTLERLESMAVWTESHTAVPGWWTFSLSILYGDIVIEIGASSLSAAQLWDMLPRQ